MSDALVETCSVFADACNDILLTALAENASNNIHLHKLVYADIRRQFGLSANLTVRAIRRVSQAMTAAKRRGRKPRMFRPTSVDYDARIFAYRKADETVSLTTTRGRLHVPLVLGDYQREALRDKRPTAATLVRSGEQWYIHIVVEDEDDPPKDGPPLGVDLGITNTATLSTGTIHSGKDRQTFKNKRNSVRASLQSKGTPGAKHVLKRLSGREHRRIRHENHVLSRRIVDEAQRHECGVIRMERLRDIRQRTKIHSRHFNRMISGWSFGQLQQFIAYKARRLGIAVELVNPAYTSQTCHQCGQRGKRNGERFSCTTCGVSHADVNAALNIAGGGACKPSRIGELCISHGSVKSPLL